MRKNMINKNSTLVSKHELLDYVSKRDFNDFVEEMRDFRDVTSTRFNLVDKRFESIERRFDTIERRLDLLERRFDELKNDFRIQVGAVLDQFKENMKINMEYMQGLESRLLLKIAERN